MEARTGGTKQGAGCGCSGGGITLIDTSKENGGPGVDRRFINCRALDVSVKVSISKSVPTFNHSKSNPAPFSKTMVPPVQQSLTDVSRV